MGIKTLQQDFFDVIDSEQKAYWLGFIAADGHVRKTGYQMSILLSRKDRQHLEHFAGMFGRPVVDSSTRLNGKLYPNCRCTLNSVHLCSRLATLGLGSGKSAHMTGAILHAVPGSLRHHFVRGVFDGDGCIYDGNGEWRFSVLGTPAFLAELSGLFHETLGLPDNPIRDGGGIGKLEVGGNWQLVKLRDWLYADATVWLHRKRELFDQITTRLSRGSSQFRGVSWNRQKNRWQASIFLDKKKVYLGFYNDEREAAYAYDRAIKRFGRPAIQRNFRDG